jgi:hypothetical protein
MRIAELEAKLAAAEKQEPVAWRRPFEGDVSDLCQWLYADEYEPKDDNPNWQALYTHPQPKREWVGPTYVVRHICASCGENVGYLGWLFTVTRMPLLKHQCKEKNT